MKNPRNQICRLITLARRARPNAEAAVPIEPPAGFAARLAIRWSNQGSSRALGNLWENLCWKVGAAAVAVCILAFVLQPGSEDPTAFDLLLAAPMRGGMIF